MSDEVVLSKIAKLANIYSNSDDVTFLYENKKWILLDGFKDVTEDIFLLLRIGEVHKRKEFAFIPTDENLVVAYRNYERINRHDSYINRLFSVVYNNYKKPVLSPITENSVLNTYVTTKLFEALEQKHKDYINDFTNNMQKKLSLPSKFLPTLCEYQKRSVLWLLHREIEPVSFPDFFEMLMAKDNETIVYKHLYSNFIQSDPPADIILAPGGILADEMGLGKTVEMLALILLHSCPEINLSPAMMTFLSDVKAKRKRSEQSLFCICSSHLMNNIIQCQKCSLWQHRKCVTAYNSEDGDDDAIPYICPRCWYQAIQDYGLLKTKATFIVSPNTIKMQWVAEIKRHIQPTLRIFLYEGVSSGKWINPSALAQYDIVITDYNILQRDIYFTQNNVSERTSRNNPRYMRVNTPILMLDWWRVLLDEAQMVESNTAKAAMLVRMIPAVNRWAVTGTPIQKSLNDLQALLQFIGFDAASKPFVWHQIVNDFILQHDKNSPELKSNASSSAMINILQKCMWRTSKDQVAAEVKIPPQQEVVHRIQFDNLEKLYYHEQHAECRSKFLANVLDYSQRMSRISPQIMNHILQPFLKIRQSCTMPVVIATSKAHKHFNAQYQKKFLQPQELHDYLKSANEISCKSELRSMASSHNGLAALYILKKNFHDAIKNYETVLKLANDYNDMNISVDSLLQIHALHNIMQIKIMHPELIVDKKDFYENQHNELEWKYLSTYASTLAAAKSSYEVAIGKINFDVADDFMDNFANALDSLLENDKLSLIQKIQEECALAFGKTNVKLFEIQSSRALLYVIELWYNKLKQILLTLQSDIENLSYFCNNVRSRHQVSPAIWRDITQLVNSVYDCHLSEIRNVQKSRKEVQKQDNVPEKNKLCKMCTIRNDINEFECLLFDKIIDKMTNYTEGVENPSFEMYICKLTSNFVKSKNRFLNIMDNNWLFLENLQLVCKRLIKFWVEIDYTIKAYDELDMCKMRITLTANAEDQSIFKIMKNEIEGRIIEQKNELMSAQNKFTIKLARLRYIRHLERDDDPGPCPICRLNIDENYAVLECGHHICFRCLKSMRLYVKGNHFKCSICRNIQQNQNIYYVSREKIKRTDNEIINGHYSSKITYIVRLIMRLQRQHNDETLSSETRLPAKMENNDLKILIFSQWEPILQAIALALGENDIKYRAQCTPKTIEEFKNPEFGITCLLMPFLKGSKGLNLVEATHVFLVEPILNPGEELQAIGRIHRFGQKRSTTIHRFIVSQTIEENIYNFIISSSSNANNTTGIQHKWEFENISLADFENLFSLQQIDECD